MEQKLKERVVGASLLVIAGVIFIPWLLDGREDPNEVNQPLSLPPAGASGGQTRTISLESPSPNDSVTPTPAPREAAAAESSSRTPAPEPAASQAPQPAPSVTRPAPTPTAPPPAPPRTDPAQGWAVQVGSFSSQSNAQRLAERLDGLGYKAFVSRRVVNDRVMYRVRVGPEASREAAAGLAERLRADKQPASVVEHPG